MAQKTNLNISPYYDDFKKDNNFYKVLFKPGNPVQARELTTLQSQLQNQVESFGSHIFKDGSCVVPGNIAYDSQYHSVKLDPDHLGVPVSLYVENLVGKRLTGQESGVTVTVDKYFLPEDRADITDLTIFVKYKNSGSDSETEVLKDGESLITEESFTYGNTPVNAGETIATLISVKATHIGSAVGIATGVYFVRGSFVDVTADKIVLDPYTNVPSYRVGLNVLEEIVTAKDDSSLYDNARGFTNYAAPGADRLKISTILSKKPLNDFNDKTFVELLKLDQGEVRKIDDQPKYNLIRDYFAKRTFEESGNYTVDRFDVEVNHSLNDGISNEGVFTSKQTTDQGNKPTDDLMCVKLSPGKAYVKGYDVDKGGTTVVDVAKPRDKRDIDSANVEFKMGNKLRLNNAIGSPDISINTNNVVDLRSERINNTGGNGGSVIGMARVYAYNLADAPYENNASEWDLELFDIQTYTYLNLSRSFSSVELGQNSFIRGVNSGATGYTTAPGGNNSGHNLTQVTGTFIVGEQVIVNEDTSIAASIKEVKSYSLNDVKAVHQSTAGVTDFKADTVLQKVYYTDSGSTGSSFSSNDTVNIDVSAKTLTSPGKNFLGFKAGQIIRYQDPTAGITSETFNKVVSVSVDGLTLTVSGIATVAGVCDGGLPDNDISVPIALGVPSLIDNSESRLYTPLDSTFVSDVDLSTSKLIVTKQLTGRTVSGNNLTINISDFTGIGSAFFEPFDAERYSIINSNGTIEELTEDQFNLASNGTSIAFKGLTNGSNIRVNCTLRKNVIKNKSKIFVRSQKLVVDRSNTGVSTSVTGLTTSVSHSYGLRVDDREVSLNVPDVSNVVKVLESVDTASPILDKLTFVSGLNLDTATVLGEKVVGDETGAVAQLVTRLSANEVEICYLNSEKFKIGEKVTFEESAITSNLQDKLDGVYLDITDRFTLDKGQREQFYDYSRLVRKEGSPSPSRKLLVVFNKYEVPSNDSGDVYTVNSYGQDRFGYDIPHLKNGLRASDTLDFRPRVADFTATNSSPFSFSARSWANSGNNPTLVVKSGEASTIGYQHYLPRTDKVVLSTSGEFMVTKGSSSIDPKVPETVENSMHIATIELPPYLNNSDDAKISLVDNRRYTMRDIGKIEDRVENLEELTSLSLLELDTKTLEVKDSQGLNRFKSGFFVDDFKGNKYMDIGDPDCTCDVDVVKQELNAPFDRYSVKPEQALDPSIDSSTADYSADLKLLDPNLRKTGDMITLNYDEDEWIVQAQASRVENVNPFNIVVFNGRIRLNPASDTWVRNVVVQGAGRTITGPTAGSFVTETRISSEVDTHIRSRNVQFGANGLKPFTRYYSFFDSTAGIDFVPKLIEISMVRGVFTAGETVEISVGGSTIGIFRIAQPNHKSGDINNPQVFYSNNPYDTAVTLPTSYAASSTVLNVDIASLADETQSGFWGYLHSVGATIVGRTSNAEATVSDLKLISDTFGDIHGSFFFRDPLATPPPTNRWRIGTKTFKLSSSSTNAQNVPGSSLISDAEAPYTTRGIVDTFQQTNIEIRMPPPPPEPIIINNTFVTNEITEVTNITQNITEVTQIIREEQPAQHDDPLAQTFRITEAFPDGGFLTSIEFYLRTIDETQPLRVELRKVELGLPTEILVHDYTQKTLYPDATTDGLPMQTDRSNAVLKTSADASVATKVTFDSPIYLNSNEEYAFVLLAPTSDKYEAWISRMGDKTIDTQNLPDGESAIVTRQYLNGSLFKSQNGSTWTPSQFEDLKFKINRCKFKANTGTLFLYNPSLGKQNNIVQRLLPNPVKTLPRKLRVGINTLSAAISGDILSPGRKVTEGTQPGPTGIIEDIGGQCKSVGSSMHSLGSGYQPSLTDSDVDTYAITGGGKGLKVRLATDGNGVPTVSLVGAASSGTGYRVGDIIGITTSSLATPKGTGAQFTINTIGNTDTLYLTNVQGKEFSTGGHIKWFNANNATSAGSGSTAVTSSEVVSGIYTGNVLEVEHYNHGLNAANNWVTLADLKPNTAPVKLTADLAVDASVISVANTSEFTTFEGISTTRGFVQINGEIIYYNGIASNELTIGGRGINNSLKRTHSLNDLAFKYELNGVSLTGINTTHNMGGMDVNVTSLRENDKYYLQIPRTGRQHLEDRDTSALDNQLSFASEEFVGGDNAFSSQNLQYNVVVPEFSVITPGNTTINAALRSISGTSSGGSELSFQDQGYEDVQVNAINRLSTPRLLASQINETKRLDSLPNNKSTTLAVVFNSNKLHVSPMLDLQNGQVIYERSRIDNPVSDYTTDDRVHRTSGDPHSGVYISKKVDLKQPASSIKVLLTAYRDSSADFRALYQLYREGSDEVEQSFELFPGYDNLKDTDNDGFGDTVIDLKNNSGRPDVKVPASAWNEFKEYQFTASDLEPFSGFRIKIVMSGTNEARAPRFKDLRVIALA